MKVPIIILGLVSAGLAYGLYQRNSSAGMEAEQAVKQFETMSNQVAEVRTKLALEQGTSIQTLSNAQYAVTRRTSDLLQLSNRLVQTTLLLKASQADAREAHASLQSKAAQIAVLESQQGDVQRQLQVIPDLRRQLAEAKGLTSPVISERDSLAQENRRLSLELADNFRKLNDPAVWLQFEAGFLVHGDAAAGLREADAGFHVLLGAVELKLEDGGVVEFAEVIGEFEAQASVLLGE